MATDLRDYFTARLNQELAVNAPKGVSTKYAELEKVTAEKVAGLRGLQLASQKIRELQDASLVARVGLDPNSLTGALANTAVATVDELTNLAPGSVAPRNDTWEEQSGLIRRAGDVAVAGAKGVVGLGDAVIGVGSLATGGMSGRGFDAMGRDSEATHRFLNDLYSPEQRLANQNVEDAKGFLGTVEAMLDNPTTIAKGVIESIPSMIAGGKIGREVLALFPKVAAKVGVMAGISPGMAGAIGEGTLMAGSQVEGIRQETADKSLSFKQSLLAAGTGVMGAAVSRLGNKTAAKLGVGDIDEAIVAGSLAKSPRGYTTSVGLSAAVESGEEALQSMGETALKNLALNKPWDEGIGEAAAQGMLTAAPLGAVGGLGARVKQEVAARASAEARQEAQKAAITTGDVSTLVDPTNPAYAPARAIAALYGNSSLPDAPPEAKEANLAKASQIVSQVQDTRDKAQEAYDAISPEKLQENKDTVAQFTAALARETDPTKRQALQDAITSTQELVDTHPQVEKSVLAETKAKLDTANKHLQEANDAVVRFNENINPGSVDVKAEVATLSQKIDEDDPVAVTARRSAGDRLIALSMALPENLTSSVATALASNQTNGLSAAQRTYLREFSEARVAENALKGLGGVSTEIYQGGNGNLGIVGHRKLVTAALAAGNQVQADRHLSTLQRFEEDHRTKAELTTQALAEHQKSGRAAQVIRTVAKTWEINRGKILEFVGAKSPARLNGAITFHKQTPEPDKMVSDFNTEAVAITASLKEMSAAYAVKFPTQGATNVPVVSQAPASTPSQPTVQPTPTVVGSNAALPGEAGATSVAGAGSASVEATGVVTPVAKEASVDSKAAIAAVASKPAADVATVSNQSKENTAEAASPVEVGTSPKPAEQASEETEQLRGLTVLREAKPVQQPEGTLLGSVYRSVNKAVAYLTQRQTKFEKDSDIKAVRPLVDMPDLLSQWSDDPALPESFLPGVELTAEQSLALNTFKDFATKWSEGIKKNFIKGSLPNSKGNTKRADQLFRDPVQDFFNEDDTMDENVVTAVAYAAYSWLVNSTRAPALMERDAILEMHGMETEDTITPKGRRALNRMSAFEDAATNSLGNLVVAALGLKAKPDAPQDYLGKVAAAFGVHALQALQREGLVTLETISAEKLGEYIPGMAKPGGSGYQYYSYIKIVRDDETLKTVGDGKTITESVKGSQSVLDKMFDSEHIPMEATLEPTPFKQRFAKRTQQTISKVQRRILKAAQGQENRIIPDMWNALQVLGDSVILKAAGWKDLESGKIQENNYDAYAAQNNNLENQLEGMRGLVKPDNLDQPFFANFEVWKNFRVGVTTRNMNLQTSKIHRFMFARPDWVSTINLADQTKVDSFRVAVAQALGIKVDQQPNADTLVLLDKQLDSDTDRTVELAQALTKAIKDPTESPLTDAQKADIGEMSAKAEGMQTLQALVAYGRYLEAKDAGAESFTATMLVGVDGKTNGPILSHLALGAAASVPDMFQMMNRGGMYSLASGIKHFSQWYKEASSLDLYEDLARAILTSLSPSTRGFNSLSVITKDLLKDGKVTSAGRKIVKTPLTSFAFGSSINKSLENMQAAFVQAVFDRIEDLATGKDKRMTREALINAINEMFSIGGLPESDLIPMETTVDELLAWEIQPEQDYALTNAFNEVLKKPVDKTMRSYFKVFIQRRDAVNKNIQASFAIYMAIYKDLRTKELDRLMESGEISYTEVSPKDKNGKAIADAPKIREPDHDLTVGQEAELRNKVASVLPQANTAYTQDSGDLGSGLMMSKQTNGLGNSPMYSVEVQMGVPVIRGDGKPSTQVLSKSMQRGEVDPGVAGLPYMMHSLDSFIMHLAMEGTQSLNVHDEKANAADKVEDTAKRINASTWSAMLEYSPASESFQMLERAVRNAVKMAEAGGVSKESLKAINAVFEGLLTEAQMEEGIPPKNLVRVALYNVKQQEFLANQVRLETMSQMGWVDQYTWEGGQYKVTDDDRKDAAKRLAAHNAQGSTITSELATEAKNLGEFIGRALEAEKPPAITFETDETKEKTNPYGTVGKPAKVSQPLVDFFEGRTEVPAAEVLKQLYSMMGSGSQFNRLLTGTTGMLRRAMPADIKVIIVTPDMVIPEDELPAKENQGKSFGWKIGNKIYVLGTGFENSGLQTTEVLLHELVHGATQHIIASPRGAEVAMVADLKSLMNQVAKYASDKGITGFEAALSDIDEFVAYGMTKKPFQELLAEISVTRTAGLVNGFKDFVNKLVGLLFARIDKTKPQEKQLESALAGLIENVTGLLESGAQEQADARSGASLPAKSATLGPLSTYSTIDIHNSLNAGSITREFDTKLQDLLSGIVDKLHGPFGAFKAALMQGQALTAKDVWHKALATGEAPFASSVQASPFRVSDQEAHAMEQVEVTMRAALERGTATATSAYRGLDRLFTEMAAVVKPTDFADPDQYEFLFNVQSSNGDRSNHLARFAAFGLANQEVNKLMQVATQAKASKTAKNWAERLQSIFDDVLEFFHQKITGTYTGQGADVKMEKLVGQLVDIEAKRRLGIARRMTGDSVVEKVEAGANKLANSGLKKISSALDAQWIQTNKYAGVQFAGKVGKAIVEHRMTEFVAGFSDYRDQHWKGRLGIVAGTLNFATSTNQRLEAFLRERKVLEGRRKDIITSRAKMALNAFANEGAGMDNKVKESITQVFMRTGMHVLTGSGKLNMTQLENLLGNKPAMDSTIAGLESQLSGLGPLDRVAINQAKALGYFLVTGRNKAQKLMMNAHNIARMRGTPYVNRVTEAQANQVEDVIKQLITLYALNYSDSQDIARAKRLLAAENARTDKKGNGVEFVLAMTKQLEEESKARIFQNQEALMTHGYTSEIYTPHVDVVTATDADGEALVRRGYTKGAEVEIDPAHPDQTKKRLYVLKGGGLMPYLTGIVSYTGKNAKGSKQHSGYMNVNTADGLANAVLHNDIMHAKQGTVNTQANWDPVKAKGNFMAPVVNPAGEIVNWRYMMHSSTKDTILQRENRFNLVMGTMAGSIFDKDTATEINTKVFEAMKDQWDAEGALKPESYVLIGPNSAEAEDRDTWSMLSDNAKAEARRIWGKEGMYVRHDSRDIIFGYRKLSIAAEVKKSQAKRVEDADRAARGMVPVVPADMAEQFEQVMARLFTRTIEHALVMHAGVKGKANPEEYAERAAWMVGQGERVWQELVGELKDLLVIKTVTVMMGNLKSNVSLLAFSGVPFKDILRDHLTAWRGATAYQRDSNELDRLQTLLEVGQTNGKDAEIKRDMARLKDAIERNPVRGLIEAGLMPTIVEDAAADEDIYSYKSALVEKVDKLTGKLHPGVKTAVKNIYLAKDTKAYQTLRHITQLSDFMARYTQYQHVTNRKVNPLSHEDAIQQSSDDFINYDIPMQRGMQYLDDMGIMPFMKYFLRIQKVIERVYKENPARMLTALTLDQFLGLSSTVLDSGWMHKVGNNPVHWGALGYPGALDELATINAATALIK